MGMTVAFEAADPAIAEGKKKYFGDRLVGKFMSHESVTTDIGQMDVYMIHLYKDMADESKFGQAPDGEMVSLRGTKIIKDAFEYGTDGQGIQPGDIVEIVIKGKKKGMSGFAKTTGYWDIAVNSFRPAPKFSPSATGQNSVAPSSAASDELGKLGY